MLGVLSEKQGYHCPNCKNFTPKSEIVVSGYDSEHSLRHIHCPFCRRIIAFPSKNRDAKSMIGGVMTGLFGGIIAFFLYPLLNIYGVQIGLFMSFYGIIKILLI